MKKLLVMLVVPVFTLSMEKKYSDKAVLDQLVSIHVTNVASKQIQFPEADKLRKKLNDIDQTHFAQNTSLIESLATKKLTEKEIKDTVVSCSNEYIKHIASSGMPENVISSMMQLKTFREDNITHLLIQAYKK